MSYNFEEIKLSQMIFYELLEKREIQEEKNRQLYDSYTTNETVRNLVKSQGEIADCNVEKYGDTIYLIPKEQNELLGFSKKQLKETLCKSNPTDKDYYLSQFVIMTLIVEFYDGQGASSKAREFIRVGELQNIISEQLQAGAQSSVDEQEQGGVAFTDMLEAYESLRSAEKGSKQKTTKEGFLYNILIFLERQGLIDYIQADEMIKTTTKLNQFMDWNLLNKNNFHRVLTVLGKEST